MAKGYEGFVEYPQTEAGGITLFPQESVGFSEKVEETFDRGPTKSMRIEIYERYQMCLPRISTVFLATILLNLPGTFLKL